MDAALGAASNKIRMMLETLSPKRLYPKPWEFEMTLVEKRVRLTRTQLDILQIFQKWEWVPLAELSKKFNKMTVQELFYRLGNLRLLMFICMRPDKYNMPSEYIYSSTLEYREVFLEYDLSEKRYGYQPQSPNLPRFRKNEFYVYDSEIES